jgi:hypothetical protein
VDWIVCFHRPHGVRARKQKLFNTIFCRVQFYPSSPNYEFSWHSAPYPPPLRDHCAYALTAGFVYGIRAISSMGKTQGSPTLRPL